MLDHGMKPVKIADSLWECPVPWGDQHGDPLGFSIARQGTRISIEDGGAVAGLLFTLELDEVGSPAFTLLSSLAQRYGLVIDYDLGVLRSNCSIGEIPYALPEFMRVVVTLLTASPHLPQKQQRRSMGPRLRRRIRDEYKERAIDSYVEQHGQIHGVSDAQWPTDFYWQLDFEGHSKNVYVLAADLNIKDPLSRASRISGLAVDTLEVRHGDDLRVVIDSATDKVEVAQAVDFICRHSSTLDYEVYDFADKTARKSFLGMAQDEILGVQGREWRKKIGGIEALVNGQNLHGRVHTGV